ncbi:MAG: hypothetical protein CMO30_15325 [Tistrella sp.]|uniref:hypothetical protein n=1 Tax=Tistrella sp. TaxID=2024861 RepID=UPI000C5B6C56|nr:hypothetical protein [Tistrella sp.]MAD39217.1 hypothetical protein [Tistrella sp.]MBA76585.1 hypothetical protein [Tistrella sp.]MBA76639.1 hypothetical protein [Tistrella sp.]|tara:strand:- start:11106 stop:11576 length:471 start_codon:yes stop_codon:yes gene_type:complete
MSNIEIVVAGTRRIIGHLVMGSIESAIASASSEAGLLILWPVRSQLSDEAITALGSVRTLIPCAPPCLARRTTIPRMALDLTDAQPTDVQRLILDGDYPQVALMPYHAYPALDRIVIGLPRERPLLPIVYDVPGSDSARQLIKTGVFAYALGENRT